MNPPDGPPELGDPEALAARLGATAFDLTVAAVTDLNADLRRVRLTAPGLADMPFVPGQDLMFAFSVGAKAVHRRYTIRHLDRAAGAVDIDIVRHADGPGAAWLESVAVGDPCTAIGPRGQVRLADDAAWHLLVGDESFTPAALAMAEHASAPGSLLLRLETRAPGLEPRHELPSTVDLEWIPRGGEAPGSAGPLVAASRVVPLPAGVGQVYLGGEFHVAHAVREVLVERGVPTDRINLKPYWRTRAANAPHGEPPRD